MRSKIVASYCNILKVSQVLAFSTLGRCSFPFYRRMEGAPRLTYGTTRVHSLYPIFRPLPLPRASVTLSYPAKGIRANTPLAKYRHAAMFNTLIRGRSARGPRADVEGAPVGRVLTWKERYPAPCLPSEGRLTCGSCS